MPIMRSDKKNLLACLKLYSTAYSLENQKKKEKMGYYKYRWLFLLTAFLSILIYSSAFAQSKGYQQRLKSLANEYGQRFNAEKQEAIKIARELGISIRKEFDDGRVSELMRFERGLPVYYITYNSNGAGVVNSDKVWPGNGGTGLSLTGAGQILGVWDGGATRSTHRELVGRVAQKDGAVTLSSHATHVAGTMAAVGISSKAKGMSFQTGLHAYDWNNAEAEMILAAADGLLVSNHSYGHITGWAYGSWSGNTGMHWFGDITVSGMEDYWFGFYSNYSRQWDEISYNAPNYLIVRAAGNDRHENHTGEHYFRSSLFRRWTLSTDYREPDGGLDGYDSIPSGGVAKNILTVGAVRSNGAMSSFSGWGPTDDGRVKPDIVAKGVSVYSPIASGDSNYSIYSGTSMASPMVTGSIGLLLQHQ
jgi:trimeric autotransporter adhesin